MVRLKMKLQTRYTLWALTGYSLLTVVMTWPAILHFLDGIPGDGFDGWQNYWNLWWVKQAFLVAGTNPFFTDYLDAPRGVSLLFHTLNIFNGMWTLPIQLNFGLAVAYNSVVFLSFVLAGLGAYLLSLYALNKMFPGQAGLRGAAFVGGLIFTMSPFHMAHLLGHMQVFSMIWPPFYILWLLRTLDPWLPAGNPPPAGQWRNAAITSLFLILATLVDWYHTLYLLMFTAVVLLWVVWRNRRSMGDGGRKPGSNPFFRPILVALAIGVGFGVILSPLLIPMVRAAGSRPDLETGLFQNITLSADLLAFVTPSEMHPLWGEWAAGIANNFTSTTSERLIFAGFVPLLLALFAIIRGWKSTIVRFWAWIGLVFLVMALGPYLHINGHIFSIGSWQIPLPYLLLYNTIPFINLTRSLSRYDLMIMLSIGVLASVAIAQIQLVISNYQLSKGRHTRHASYLWFPVVAGGLICFEFLPAPYPVSQIDTPQFYYNIGSDGEDYTIAELPMNWDRPTPLLHQTAHGKRLLTAYTSRDNPQELAWRTPVFQHWKNLGPDIINQSLAEIAPTIFFDFNLRYIVLDYFQMPPGPERDGTEQWVFAALPDSTPVYDDGRLKVYRTPPLENTQPYLSLGDGWGKRTDHGDGLITRRALAQEAELFIHHPPSGQPLTLIFSVVGQSSNQEIAVLVGNTVITSVPVTQSLVEHKITLPPADASLIKVKLTSGNSPDSIDISGVGLEIVQ